jgi:dolichol kinase
MRPELPFLAAGAVAVTGGAIREHHWPANANRAVIGTVVLTVVASATASSRFAPLVHAVGLLLLLTAVMATATSIQNSKKGVKKP